MPGGPLGRYWERSLTGGLVTLLIVVVFPSPLPCVILRPKLVRPRPTLSKLMASFVPTGTFCVIVRSATRVEETLIESLLPLTRRPPEPEPEPTGGPPGGAPPGGLPGVPPPVPPGGLPGVPPPVPPGG